MSPLVGELAGEDRRSHKATHHHEDLTWSVCNKHTLISLVLICPLDFVLLLLLSFSGLLCRIVSLKRVPFALCPTALQYVRAASRHGM